MNSENENEHWALKHFEHNDWKPSVVATYGFPVLSGTTCFFLAVWKNAYEKRPYYSHLHNHIILTIIGVCIPIMISREWYNTLARKDSIAIDYIKRHPDRFPAPERKKYADTFIEWIPKR